MNFEKLLKDFRCERVKFKIRRGNLEIIPLLSGKLSEREQSKRTSIIMWPCGNERVTKGLKDGH